MVVLRNRRLRNKVRASQAPPISRLVKPIEEMPPESSVTAILRVSTIKQRNNGNLVPQAHRIYDRLKSKKVNAIKFESIVGHAYDLAPLTKLTKTLVGTNTALVVESLNRLFHSKHYGRMTRLEFDELETALNGIPVYALDDTDDDYSETLREQIKRGQEYKNEKGGKGNLKERKRTARNEMCCRFVQKLSQDKFTGYEIHKLFNGPLHVAISDWTIYSWISKTSVSIT